ncbi:MAG TPA: glycosyltransferase [Pyrinomonadaceae bacterium]|nr:glycosyltransferase [Pyrinomonadaceae bacterium]
MKIVRIIARLNVGGPARHVVWLTKALNNEEFQSSLLTGSVPEGEEDMSYFAEENGVQPFYIPEMSRELSAKDIVSLWKVYRQICREKPEIIHTHTAKAGFVGRTAGFFYRWLNWKKVKIVHTFHGHVFHSYYGNLKTKLFLFIEKNLARFVTDKIIVITPQQFKEIHHDFGVGKKEQFQIIPLGIDLEKFVKAEEKRSILRDEIGAKPDEILVGFVGRLTEIKNVSMLLKVAELYEKNKISEFPKLKFVIIGDGNMRESLEKEAESLGLKGKVLFLGNRNDANIFYAGLDIVALVSLNEGTPLSLIEAMANGRAVISTNVGGVVDLLGAVESEENNFKVCERGVRIDSHSAEDFYQGLLHLAQKSELRENYVNRGKTFTESNYSKTRLIKDISELYRNLRPS